MSLKRVLCYECGLEFYVPDGTLVDVEFCPFCGMEPAPKDVPVGEEEDDD